MHRSFTAATLTAALMLAGCGQSNNPPQAAPATAGSPSAADAAAAEEGLKNLKKLEAQDAPAADLSPAATPAEEAASEEMPDKAPVAAANPAEHAPVADVSKETADAPSESDSASAPAPARPRANRPARKLLRGLASSLTRAVAKAVNDQSANSEQPAAAEAKAGPPEQPERPAVPPKSGDPFPEGEPDDAKPNE